MYRYGLPNAGKFFLKTVRKPQFPNLCIMYPLCDIFAVWSGSLFVYPSARLKRSRIWVIRATTPRVLSTIPPINSAFSLSVKYFVWVIFPIFSVHSLTVSCTLFLSCPSRIVLSALPIWARDFMPVRKSFKSAVLSSDKEIDSAKFSSHPE